MIRDGQLNFTQIAENSAIPLFIIFKAVQKVTGMTPTEYSLFREKPVPRPGIRNSDNPLDVPTWITQRF